METMVTGMTNAVTNMFSFATTALTTITGSEELSFFFWCGLAFGAVALLKKLK